MNNNDNVRKIAQQMNNEREMSNLDDWQKKIDSCSNLGKEKIPVISKLANEPIKLGIKPSEMSDKQKEDLLKIINETAAQIFENTRKGDWYIPLQITAKSNLESIPIHFGDCINSSNSKSCPMCEAERAENEKMWATRNEHLKNIEQIKDDYVTILDPETFLFIRKYRDGRKEIIDEDQPKTIDPKDVKPDWHLDSADERVKNMTKALIENTKKYMDNPTIPGFRRFIPPNLMRDMISAQPMALPVAPIFMKVPEAVMERCVPHVPYVPLKETSCKEGTITQMLLDSKDEHNKNAMTRILADQMENERKNGKNVQFVNLESDEEMMTTEKKKDNYSFMFAKIKEQVDRAVSLGIPGEDIKVCLDLQDTFSGDKAIALKNLCDDWEKKMKTNYEEENGTVRCVDIKKVPVNIAMSADFIIRVDEHGNDVEILKDRTGRFELPSAPAKPSVVKYDNTLDREQVKYFDIPLTKENTSLVKQIVIAKDMGIPADDILVCLNPDVKREDQICQLKTLCNDWASAKTMLPKTYSYSDDEIRKVMNHSKNRKYGAPQGKIVTFEGTVPKSGSGIQGDKIINEEVCDVPHVPFFDKGGLMSQPINVSYMQTWANANTHGIKPTAQMTATEEYLAKSEKIKKDFAMLNDAFPNMNWKIDESLKILLGTYRNIIKISIEKLVKTNRINVYQNGPICYSRISSSDVKDMQGIINLIKETFETIDQWINQIGEK